MITTQKLIIFLTTLILSLHFFHSADANNCSASACGAIRNISFPFHLNSHCGHPENELTCENDVTFLHLNSIKYHVKAINYDLYIIRLVDASINNDDICSFPTQSSYPLTFIAPSSSPYYSPSPYGHSLLNLISCPNPLNNSTSLFIDITQHCASNLSHPTFRYVHVGCIHASELPHVCTLDLIVTTSWPGFVDLKNVSLSKIHQSLVRRKRLTTSLKITD